MINQSVCRRLKLQYTFRNYGKTLIIPSLKCVILWLSPSTSLTHFHRVCVSFLCQAGLVLTEYTNPKTFTDAHKHTPRWTGCLTGSMVGMLCKIWGCCALRVVASGLNCDFHSAQSLLGCGGNMWWQLKLTIMTSHSTVTNCALR